MPIDPRIPMSYQAPQFDNPLDVRAKIRQGDLQEQQIKSQQMQMSEAQAKAQRDSFRRDVWSADESNWADKVNEWRAAGVPNADKLPDVYVKGFHDRLKLATLDPEEQLAQSNREAQMENDALNRKEARADRWAMAGMQQREREEVRNEKREEKVAEKQEKKATALNEVEDRKTNILQNLDILDKMIEKNGTYEMFGSHNQDMNRLVETIATDMAKLQDPSSVARPSEVEAVKANLVKPGFSNTNATARDILKNFKNEVERRAQTAYKVRGIEQPQFSDTKIVDGRTYVKVKGGWELAD